MASTPDLNLWADITLRSAECLLADIYHRAPDWDSRPEGERLDFFLEWEAIVDRLERVASDDRAGALTPDRGQRLRTLARRLQEAREVIVRLGLDYPELGHLSLAS